MGMGSEGSHSAEWEVGSWRLGLSGRDLVVLFTKRCYACRCACFCLIDRLIAFVGWIVAGG